ncbi:MAG: hypothetical protein QM820_57970 [Minicystis sp.]
MALRSMFAALFSSSFVVGTLLAGCAVAPETAVEPEDTGEAHEAICADGTIPGCGECYADPTSPQGGYQTCFTCTSERTRACTPPLPCGGDGQICCASNTPHPGCQSGLECVADPLYPTIPKCRPIPTCGQYGLPCCSPNIAYSQPYCSDFISTCTYVSSKGGYYCQ